MSILLHTSIPLNKYPPNKYLTKNQKFSAEDIVMQGAQGITQL